MLENDFLTVGGLASSKEHIWRPLNHKGVLFSVREASQCIWSKARAWATAVNGPLLLHIGSVGALVQGLVEPFSNGVVHAPPGVGGGRRCC